MFDKFSLLKSVVTTRGARTDSPIFRLHYAFTVAVLSCATVLVSGTQWVGKSIHCAFNKQLFSEDYIEAICWVNGTYYHPNDKIPSSTQVAPHIRPGRGSIADGDIRYVQYYQWVAFCLVFQAILFYIPRWIWKELEGGTVERLLKQPSTVAPYLCHNSKRSNRYFACYMLAEVLAMGNLIGQMFLLDKFFDGMFVGYGVSVMQFAKEDFRGRNPMLAVFPRMTKCSLKAFALNGNVDTIEGLCILPLNIINEKIYLFQWFWFFLLFVLTAGLLLYRLVLFVSPGLQIRVLACRVGFTERKRLVRVFKQLSVGDWFLLYTLAPHLSFTSLSDVLYELDARINSSSTGDRDVIGSDAGGAGDERKMRLKLRPPPPPPKPFFNHYQQDAGKMKLNKEEMELVEFSA